MRKQHAQGDSAAMVVIIGELAGEFGDNGGDRGFEIGQAALEIGRASCRERVEISVGAGSFKKKKIEKHWRGRISNKSFNMKSLRRVCSHGGTKGGCNAVQHCMRDLLQDSGMMLHGRT